MTDYIHVIKFQLTIVLMQNSIVHMVLYTNSNVHGWMIFKCWYLYSSFFHFMVDLSLFPLTTQLIKKKKLHAWMVFDSSHVKHNQIFCPHITITIKNSSIYLKMTTNNRQIIFVNDQMKFLFPLLFIRMSLCLLLFYFIYH